MLLVDVLQRMSRAQRSLSAQRWGLESGPAAVLAERAMAPDVAQRLFHLLGHAGAPNLTRMLVENGGASLPQRDDLSSEASVLRDWGLLVEDGDAWALPTDLALAMDRCRHHERYFLGTLLAGLGPKDVQSLAEELGTPLAGSPVRSLAQLRNTVMGTAADADFSDIRAAAETASSLEPAELPRVGAIRLVAGHYGRLFVVNLDGVDYTVAPREIAHAMGYRFVDATVEGLRPETVALNDVPTLTVEPVSALLQFSTHAMLQEALRNARFGELVLEVVGDRRVLLKEGLSAPVIRDALLRLGFEDVPGGTDGGSYAS